MWRKARGRCCGKLLEVLWQGTEEINVDVESEEEGIAVFVEECKKNAS